jgi:hypothetical protein
MEKVAGHTFRGRCATSRDRLRGCLVCRADFPPRARTHLSGGRRGPTRPRQLGPVRGKDEQEAARWASPSPLPTPRRPCHGPVLESWRVPLGRDRDPRLATAPPGAIPGLRNIGHGLPDLGCHFSVILQASFSFAFSRLRVLYRLLHHVHVHYANPFACWPRASQPEIICYFYFSCYISTSRTIYDNGDHASLKVFTL